MKQKPFSIFSWDKYMTKSLGYLGGGFNPAEKYVRQIALFPHVRVNQKKSKPPARYEIFRKPKKIVRIIRRHPLWQFLIFGQLRELSHVHLKSQKFWKGNKTYVCHSTHKGRILQPYTVWMIQWPEKNIYVTENYFQKKNHCHKKTKHFNKAASGVFRQSQT